MSATSATADTLFPMPLLTAAPVTTWMAALTPSRQGLALYDLHDWEIATANGHQTPQTFGYVKAPRAELIFVKELLRPFVGALRNDKRFKVHVMEFDNSVTRCLVTIVNLRWRQPK